MNNNDNDDDQKNQASNLLITVNGLTAYYVSSIVKVICTIAFTFTNV